jgi:hypothetical protein
MNLIPRRRMSAFAFRRVGLLLPFAVAAHDALACSGCAPLVRAHLFQRGDFFVTLAIVLTPLVAVALVASLLQGMQGLTRDVHGDDER